MSADNRFKDFENNFQLLMYDYYKIPGNLKDFHVVRFYSALVAISNEKVLDVRGEFLSYCPLANHFYKQFLPADQNNEDIKISLQRIIEAKIKNLGFFTPRRVFEMSEIAVPFGASEMMMCCLEKNVIDCAVVVCEGVGSVIVKDPAIVQGIGGRMNGLFFTTPIHELQEKLTAKGCDVVFPDARIDQFAAVEKACKIGFKRIAVTINACMHEDDFSCFKDLESKYSVEIIILIICTTSVAPERIEDIKESADLVWSCASSEIRSEIGRKAILQISKRIPVFVLSRKGIEFVAGYSKKDEVWKTLDLSRQYVLSNVPNAKEVIMGKNFSYFLHEDKLPIRSPREPRF